MQFVIKFDEGAKQVMLAGLDMLVRDIGRQLEKAGGGAAQDAVAKIISIRNVAIGIEQAAQFEEPTSEVNKGPENGLEG